MKKRILQETCFSICLFHYILITMDPALAERKAVPIGISNSSQATAFNNARKIVRTSDDIRLVVYQDSVDQESVVMWTWSADGFTWSQPEVLGAGEFPALTIGSDDRIYAAWTDADSMKIHLASFQRESPDSKNLELLNTSQDNSGLTGNHASLEISAGGIWLVAECEGYIHFAHYDMDTFTPYWTSDVRLYTPNGRCCFPSITGDLEFVPGVLHVLWTDSLDYPDAAKIGYWQLIEDEIEIMDFYSHDTEYIEIEYPDAWLGKSFPSISARNWHSGFFVMAYSDLINNMLTVTSAYSDKNGVTTIPENKSTVPVSGNPMPSMDDILPFRNSCAIVWQNAGEIYYAQTEDDRIITDPPVQVSVANGSLKQFPSVCYKTFRGDSFDVVWTEGNRAPYKVMYRRMAKCYMADPVRFLSNNLHNAVVGFRYVLIFDISGGGGTYTLKPIDGALPDHSSFYKDEIWGEAPDSAGVYHFTLVATDLAQSSSDIAEFTLTIKENRMEFNSPDSVVAEKGRAFSYTARAVDPWGRKAQCTFGYMPVWLAASDSVISGSVPMNSADTCFQVIATYQDQHYYRRDTMAVKIHPLGTDGIIDEENLTERPIAFTLYPNFPNPFNPSTTIQYAVPEAGSVSIDLLDLKGNSVKNLVEGRLSAGYHSVVLNGSDIPSGVYLIRMAAARFTAIRKCILLK
jgi:hypothetical protein